MKRNVIIWAVMLLIGVNITVFSQDEEVPFVFAGGPLIQAMLLDLAPLESALSVTFPGTVQFSNQPVFASFGGFGFAGRDMRFGAMSVGAQWQASTDDDTSVHLKFNYDALLVEAAMFRTSSTAIWIGSIAGLGDWQLERRGLPASSFANAIAVPNKVKLTRPTMIVQPYLSVEQAFGIVGIKLTAGMTGAISVGGWQVADGILLNSDVLSVAWMPTISLMFILGV
jgi:hypothetical protein